MAALTEFGKQIKVALVEKGKTQKWLIEQVAEKTGLYFDRAYVYRISTGQNNNPKMVEAIREVLNL